MRALKVQIYDSETGRTREERYTQSPVRIGRHPQNELCLSFGFVSGKHAQVDFDARGGSFVDLGSTNGSTVDGHRLEAGHAVAIAGGLSVTVGKLEMRFSWTEAEGARPQPPVDVAGGVVSRAPRLPTMPIQAVDEPAGADVPVAAMRTSSSCLPERGPFEGPPAMESPASFSGGPPAMEGPPAMAGGPPPMQGGPPPMQGGPPSLDPGSAPGRVPAGPPPMDSAAPGFDGGGPPPLHGGPGGPPPMQGGPPPLHGGPGGPPPLHGGGPPPMQGGPPPLHGGEPGFAGPPPLDSSGAEAIADTEPPRRPSGAEATGFVDLSSVHRVIRELRPAYEQLEAARLGFQRALDDSLAHIPANTRETALAFLRREFPEMPGATPFASAPTASVEVVDEAAASPEAVEQFAAALLHDVAPPSSAEERQAFLARVVEVLQTSGQAFVEIRNVQTRFGDEMGVRVIREYTPLHSAGDARNVLDYLLDWRRGGPERNAQLSAVYSDFMLHQVALINGVVEGVQALMEQFRPTEIERGVGGLSKSAAAWKKFTERYAEVIDERGIASLVFGPEFARAYAEVGSS